MERDSLYVSRYLRNRNSIEESENNVLKKSKILIAGCGGLGGYAADFALRIGIKYISVLDKDSFEVSNLNRQLFCTEKTIGSPKSVEAVKRLRKIDSTSVLKPVHKELNSQNAADMLKGHDLIIDAFDSIPAKILLENACENLGITLVHGAVGGWEGQVSTIYPGDGTLKKIYKDREEGMEKEAGVLSFTAAITAGYQIGEAVKILLGKPGILRHRLMRIDVFGNTQTILNIA